MPPHFWLWTSVLLGAFFVVYWRVAEGKLERAKGALMAKQRAVAVALGDKLLPFRDHVEGWAVDLAGPWKNNEIHPDAELEQIRREPGVYFRLLLEQARDPKTIQKAAERSLLDGFTSCLFVQAATADPAQGKPCQSGTDCEPGKLCNEYKVCQPPPRPYNLRLAYRSLRVLSSAWTDEVHEAQSELAVTAYDRDLDSVIKRDVPIAAEILSRAKFVTILLDEKPEGGLPEEIPDAGESDSERVQRAAHPVRIGVWDLGSKRNLVRFRSEASGRFVPVGRKSSQNPVALAAQQRQANNCALALELKQALTRD